MPTVSNKMGIKEPGSISCIEAKSPSIKQGTKKPTDWKTCQAGFPGLRELARGKRSTRSKRWMRTGMCSSESLR